MNHALRYTCIVLTLAAGATASCRKPTAPAATSQVIVAQATPVPSDPADAAWNAAPEFVAKMILQDLVEPRLLKPSTAEASVRAITDGQKLAVRIAWTDPVQNDLPGASRFCDACAIQVPTKTEPTVPAPQMGEPSRPVEITYWSAAWQAIVDGRGDKIQDIYPRASVDYYPFESRPLDADPDAKRAMEVRYAPARALHNPMAGPRQTAVQDLVAEGPGSLTPASEATSTGRGQRTEDGWVVVITRRLPAGVTAEVGTQVAFAVWEGGQDEVASRKMRTGWIPLNLQTNP